MFRCLEGQNTLFRFALTPAKCQVDRLMIPICVYLRVKFLPHSNRQTSATPRSTGVFSANRESLTLAAGTANACSDVTKGDIHTK